MKNRDTYWRRYKIQETLYIGQWCLSPLQSRHLGTSSNSPNHHQLPHSIFLNLIDGLKSLLFQRWFSLGKVRSRKMLNLGCRGSESPGWFDVSLKNSTQDVMHEWAYEHRPCRDEATSHQLPIAAVFWIIWIVSVEECSSLMQNSMQIHCSTCSFECDGHTVHMLIQQRLPPPLTSTVQLSLFTHAHSSPLSSAARLHWCCANHFCYINNGWSFSG